MIAPAMDEQVMLCRPGSGDQHVAGLVRCASPIETIFGQQWQEMLVGKLSPWAGVERGRNEASPVKGSQDQAKAIKPDGRIAPTRAERRANQIFCRHSKVPAGSHAAPVG